MQVPHNISSIELVLNLEMSFVVVQLLTINRAAFALFCS